MSQLSALPNELIFLISKSLKTKSKLKLMTCSKESYEYRKIFMFTKTVEAIKIFNLDYYDQFTNIYVDRTFATLMLSKYSNHLLKKNCRLPIHITHINLRHNLITIPNTISHLTIDNSLVDEIYAIPDSVTHLTICPRLIINKHVIPSSVKYLKFIGYCDDNLSGIIPRC